MFPLGEPERARLLTSPPFNSLPKVLKHIRKSGETHPLVRMGTRRYKDSPATPHVARGKSSVETLPNEVGKLFVCFVHTKYERERGQRAEDKGTRDRLSVSKRTLAPKT